MSSESGNDEGDDEDDEDEDDDDDDAAWLARKLSFFSSCFAASWTRLSRSVDIFFARNFCCSLTIEFAFDRRSVFPFSPTWEYIDEFFGAAAAAAAAAADDDDDDDDDDEVLPCSMIGHGCFAEQQ